MRREGLLVLRQHRAWHRISHNGNGFAEVGPEPRFAAPIGGKTMKNHRKDQKGKGLGRREFVKVSLAAGASLAAPMIFTRSASAQEARVRKIVQWKHLVPDYDKWFDGFAKEFG